MIYYPDLFCIEDVKYQDYNYILHRNTRCIIGRKGSYYGFETKISG